MESLRKHNLNGLQSLRAQRKQITVRIEKWSNRMWLWAIRILSFTMPSTLERLILGFWRGFPGPFSLNLEQCVLRGQGGEKQILVPSLHDTQAVSFPFMPQIHHLWNRGMIFIISKLPASPANVSWPPGNQVYVTSYLAEDKSPKTCLQHLP